MRLAPQFVPLFCLPLLRAEVGFQSCPELASAVEMFLLFPHFLLLTPAPAASNPAVCSGILDTHHPHQQWRGCCAALKCHQKVQGNSPQSTLDENEPMVPSPLSREQLLRKRTDIRETLRSWETVRTEGCLTLQLKQACGMLENIL